MVKNKIVINNVNKGDVIFCGQHIGCSIEPISGGGPYTVNEDTKKYILNIETEIGNKVEVRIRNSNFNSGTFCCSDIEIKDYNSAITINSCL